MITFLSLFLCFLCAYGSDLGSAEGITARQTTSSDLTEAFPVLDTSWNCEVLSPDYQVRWKINDEFAEFQLVGRIASREYMGFGPSGSDTSSKMIGTDAVIAYREDGNYKVVDYYLQQKVPCSTVLVTLGACPDTKFSSRYKGTNDVSDVTGDSSEDGEIVMVKYLRPLAQRNVQLDKAIKTDGDSYVSWAVGRLVFGTPVFHFGRGKASRSDVKINFGRTVANEC